MKRLRQELNTKDDSFTYTVIGESTPSFKVDSNANLIDLKQGKTIGKYKLMHDQWHLYIDDVLIDSSGVNTLFYLPEFELKTLTALVNK